MTRLLGPACIAVGISLNVVTSAVAQTLDGPSVGVVIAAGFEGPMQALRLSAPVGAKDAFDFDLGRIAGNGATYGMQYRHLFWGRSTSGGSSYFLFGLSHVNLESQTEVRWPGGRTTYLVEHGPSAILHVGIGGDWVSSRGTRVGAELTSGGGEWLVVYAKFFVTWGWPRR